MATLTAQRSAHEAAMDDARAQIQDLKTRVLAQAARGDDGGNSSGGSGDGRALSAAHAQIEELRAQLGAAQARLDAVGPQALGGFVHAAAAAAAARSHRPAGGGSVGGSVGGSGSVGGKGERLLSMVADAARTSALDALTSRRCGGDPRRQSVASVGPYRFASGTSLGPKLMLRR
eukprot:358311-Chlamydomonas_euryale.AAC.2